MDLNEQRQWFDAADFAASYHTDLPLGALRSPAGTCFRLWAPTAQAVTLALYAAGDGGAALETHALQQGDRGLWTWETERDLDGLYYDYQVTVEGVTRTCGDPWARACGLNGRRSMVLDLSRTDPEGWDADRAPAHTPEQIIYELHVKDFSWDPAGGFDPADRGRYSALCRTGTTLRGEGRQPTGLDYLKSLGVTHIQLMPVYDYGSVDEAGDGEQYNWGYDPVNYNIPEGSYASDPRRGEVRIRELKEAVQALHRHGFRVIMDVVYNHTYDLDASLWRTAPWYFYRQRPDGSPSNGSGCGNELASERSMCARYILDSVLYWAEEYHMDGFRFDLMGLLDTELMDRIQAALDRRFGPGEKLIYGEPWRAEEPCVRPGTVLCTKDHLQELDPRIAAFCDDTRDAVKGSLMDLRARGFVNGGGIDPEVLRRCVTAWSCDPALPARAPSQAITYLSCHDDWTLWDKLVATLDPAEQFEAPQPAVLRANRMAAAIYLCCQGRPFLLAGEEFGRTKGGVKNSYCSAPAVNRLDWTRAWDYQELVDYYRGLFALRMQLPALQDKSTEAARRVLSVETVAPGCAAIRLTQPESPWTELLLLYNGGSEEQQVSLPDGRWQCLVDAESSFRWQEAHFLTGNAQLPPIAALILGKVE